MTSSPIKRAMVGRIVPDAIAGMKATVRTYQFNKTLIESVECSIMCKSWGHGSVA